jgi:thiamine-phosphate pyrophosphorylase
VSARPLLIMVSDRSRLAHDRGRGGPGDPIDAVVAAASRAARAGATMIHVRERGLDDRTLFDVTKRIQHGAEGTPTKVLVNDRADIAMAAAADGVHLPATAPAAVRVRAIVPPGSSFIVGRSVHSEAEAVAAEQTGGCDYLIFGTVFESVSKPGGHAIAGLDGLARVCAAVTLPVVAIGGIVADHAAAIARAGAAGIAAIGLFAHGEDEEIRARVRMIEDAFTMNAF